MSREGAVALTDRLAREPLEYSVAAGQAAFSYSCMSPSHLVVRSTCACRERVGRVGGGLGAAWLSVDSAGWAFLGVWCPETRLWLVRRRFGIRV